MSWRSIAPLYRIAAALMLVVGLGATGMAAAAEKLVYLFPAPSFLPAFAPFMLAKAQGYYAAEDLDVEFVVGKGGADVAKQVGAGNADLGGGIGDTSIIVRPNGVPVKSVAVLGGRALTQLVTRADSGVQTPADLKGKTIAVMSYQDTTFYALLGALAAFNLTKDDVSAQAVGPAGVSKLMITGDAQAAAAVPEWGAAIEDAGVAIKWFAVDEYFPGMAQAIIASDAAIAKKPRAIRGFVQATLKALAEIMQDPKAAAKAYVAAVPQHAGKEASMEKILAYYAEKVYPGQKVLGEMDEARLAKLQDFYFSQGIIRTKSPVADLYTNQFVR